MIYRSFVLVSVLGAALLAASPAPAAITTAADLQRICDEVRILELDPARAHDVQGAALVRDIGTLRLDKGVLVFAKEIEGVTPAAVFLGNGSFSVTPVREIDREMMAITMKDHLGKETGGMITTALREAFLFGFDGTWKDLRGALSEARAATDEEMDRARRIVKEKMKIGDDFAPFDQTQDPGSSPEFWVMGAALADPAMPPDALWTEVHTEDYGWLAFAWMPSSTYEVRLGTREAVGAFLDYHPFVKTHRKEDLSPEGKVIVDPRADLHEVMSVKRYRMDLEIPNLNEINIDVDVTFVPDVDGMKLVGFALVNDTQGPRWDSRAKYVDALSVTNEKGIDLPFLHRKNGIIIIPDSPPQKGKELTWNFKLHERTIVQFSDNHFSLLNTYPWYPQYGYLGGQFEYDWTIKTVKPYSATGSGTPIKTWEEGKLNAIQMVSERPVLVPSIIFGRYKAEEDEYRSIDGGTIKLAVHSWPQTRFPTQDGQFVDISVPRGKPKSVLEDSQKILKFMEDLFGPFPYDRLDVAMMSPNLNFGQAPPGFVQLTGEAFMSSSLIASFTMGNADFVHGFFSHEVAHQWWGHELAWIADEDQWLSESFAEYASGLYVLALLGERRFREKMREWKEQAEIADPHGSIAWCNNLSGTNGFQWRTQLIYNKGPYVVHMLRMMLGMDKFTEALKEVLSQNKFQLVTTAAVQAAAERAAGYKLDFFFDQWFRSSGIPVFDYSWETEQAEDGTHLLTITTSQRDKANYKQVLMPVYIYLAGQDDPLIRTRIMTQPEDVYRLKIPKKPVRVVLDENHDILGDMIPAAGSGM